MLMIALTVVVGTLGLVTPTLGQTIFGTILGTVTDPSGAVMPKVVVTVTNQGENISREVRTDAQGNYLAENMKAGIYTVSAKVTGFREITLTDIRLDARQSVRADLNLIDFDRLRLHQPEIVHDLPAGGRRLVQRVDGYRATLVAGAPIFEHGQDTGARPGRLVRNGG